MSGGAALPESVLEANVRRFIWFRLFFNARFYYPVFTILFLDFGLSLEQFAILNVVWAITIVAAEVPSGALADIVGRRRLLVTAAFLMFIEMAVLVLVPVGASGFLFLAFLVNRICSGLAEAAASGADEALAFDSLKALGRESEWADILEKVSRVMAVGFFIVMITGALVYDQGIVNGALALMNPEWGVAREITIKLPIILCLCTSCIVIVTTLGMRELPSARETRDKPSLRETLVGPFRQVLLAARWTLTNRFVLIVILAALVIDSVARQMVVLASEYYRTIDIPTAWFGFIGAALSLLGVLHARISRHLVTRHSPFFNFCVLSAALLIGLTGALFVVPVFGLFFMVPVFAMMGMVAYQSSFYINREVDSSLRATVLSFRGLAFNLGLGLASLFYTGLIAILKGRIDVSMEPSELQERVFAGSLRAFPLYFLLLAALVLILGKFLIRRSYLCFTVGTERPSGG